MCLSNGEVVLSWEVSSHDRRSSGQEDKRLVIFWIHVESTVCAVPYNLNPPSFPYPFESTTYSAINRPMYNCLSSSTEVKSWKHPHVNSFGVRCCNVQFLLLEFGSNYPLHSNHKRSQLQQASTPMFDDCTRSNCVVVRLLLTHEENRQIFKRMCGFPKYIYAIWISVWKPEPQNPKNKTKTTFCVFALEQPINTNPTVTNRTTLATLYIPLCKIPLYSLSPQLKSVKKMGIKTQTSLSPPSHFLSSSPGFAPP